MQKGAFAVLVLSIHFLTPFLADANGQTLQVPTADGNRHVAGRIELHYSLDVVLRLSEVPVWIAGAGAVEASTWFVLLKSGRVNRITITRTGEAEVVDLGERSGGQFQLDDQAATAGLFNVELSQGNLFASPVRIEGNGRVAAITKQGRLVISEFSDRWSVGERYLLDSRILQQPDGRLLLLAFPTNRYPHSILGDPTEAGGFRIVDSNATPTVAAELRLESGVFETLSPIWTDTDGDGTPEIVITRSDRESGSRIELYSESTLIAASAPVGRAQRWIHTVAAAPTGFNGEMEIIAVKTPHIGGILEYYRVTGDRLELVHSRPGVSTHRIGSRNIDMALVGDFNSDGRPEVLVPSDDFRRLLSIRRTTSGSEIDYTYYLESPLSTNIAALWHEGAMFIAVGMENREFTLISSF